VTPILDAHLHLGRAHLPAGEAEGMLAACGAAGAAVFADPESGDLEGDNRYVLSAARGKPLLFPYLYVGGNPYDGPGGGLTLPPPSALEGYRGIKWHCWFTPAHDSGGGPLGMPPGEAEGAVGSPGVAALMEAAAGKGLPVCLEEHFQLTLLFVALYPRTRFIIPHMGMLNGGAGAVLAALAGRGNVWFDTSLAAPDAAVIRRLGADRVLFGSDHPYGHPATSLARLRSLRLPPSDEEKVLGGNLLGLLNPQGKD